jgi:hypothetical protein
MLIANPWYESGSFWQFAITTLVAVAVGALGAFATLRASNPKLRLSYRALINTSLLTASTRQAAHLSVTYGGTVVPRPRLVEVELRNAGRRDITASMFHGGDPIKFDLGADVIAVLDVDVQPGATTPPRVVATGTSVEVHPSLLVRQQSIVISVLVDGHRTDLSCQAPLVDVEVRVGREQDQLGTPTRLAIRAGVAGGVLSTFSMLGAAGWFR